VGQAVGNLAAELDFDVWVLDDREEFASRERFPQAQRLIAGPIGATLSNLTVNGKINTPTSTAQVPDYVFEPSYHLMPLSDLESFTRANKHLPEVPSADEMSRDGMDLKAMNLVLLKKVEELTLHVIELSKQVQSLEAQKAEKGRTAP
jgi:hypothetical protein